MRTLRKIADFILYSNLFVSVCAFCYTLFQFKLNGHHFSELSILYSLLVLCAVFFVYGAQRMFLVVTRKTPSHSPRERWYIQNNFLMYALLCVSCASAIFLCFYLNAYLILCFFPLLLIAVLYYAGPLPLRALAGLKSFIIALVWILVCSTLPYILFFRAPYTLRDLAFDVSQFLFIAALCIPFDIRDYRRDKAAGIRSLPVLLGVRKAAYFALMLMILFPMVATLSGLPEFIVYALSAVSLSGIMTIVFTSIKRSTYYYGFVVESIVALPLPVLMLCELVFA